MTNKITILILLLFNVQLGYGQKKTIPKNIDEAIQILIKDCPDSLKATIKITGNDTILNLIYPWSSDFNSYKTISDWTTGIYSKKKSKIEKYYSKLGINYIPNIETIILISFKNFLISNSHDHENVIKPFQKTEARWAKEDSARLTTDSLRGVYIPKDLEDCFLQINNFWDDSTKLKVKLWAEEEFCRKAHMGFGIWMRNNWQLWGGSRLSKYFIDLGIYHPDDMSGIILVSYHRYLNGNDIKLEEQIKVTQDYWKKLNETEEKKK
jgi:hypothetical protein